MSLQQELGAFFGTDLEMRNNNVGVGLIIIDIANGNILIGEEPKKKSTNGILYYQDGERTIPTETRKKREIVLHNVQAAILEEIYGNRITTRNRNVLNHYLYMPETIDGRKHFMKSNISLPETSKRADLLIVGYDGNPSDAIHPNSYLINTQWLPISKMKDENNYRETTKKFLDEAFPIGSEKEMMQIIIDDFTRNREACIGIFPENFNPTIFSRNRKKMNDCSLK